MIINFQNCPKNAQRWKSSFFGMEQCFLHFKRREMSSQSHALIPIVLFEIPSACIKIKIEWVSSCKHKHFKCSLQYSIGIVYFTFQYTHTHSTTHKLWINRRNWIAIYRPNCLYYCYIQLDPEMYIISLWNWVPFCKEKEKMLAV